MSLALLNDNIESTMLRTSKSHSDFVTKEIGVLWNLDAWSYSESN